MVSEKNNSAFEIKGNHHVNLRFCFGINILYFMGILLFLSAFNSLLYYTLFIIYFKYKFKFQVNFVSMESIISYGSGSQPFFVRVGTIYTF